MNAGRLRRALGAAALAAAVAAALSGCASLPAAGPPAGGVASLPAEAQADPDRYVVVTFRNDEPLASSRASSTPHGYDGARSYGPSGRARGDARGLARDFGLTPVAAWPIEVLDVHCVVYRLAAGRDAPEALRAIGRDARVESVQPLATFATLESHYNDPYRGLQRNLDELAVEAAHVGSRGSGVRIAVVDTGVDARHPDLDPARIVVHDYVGTAPVAPERHGTEIAGVIAAVANNRLGIAGIAPAATVYVLRACWHPAADAGATCNTFTLAQALAGALAVRADVINLSLAGPADPLLERLVGVAVRRGAVVVGAVEPGDPPGRFPGRLPGVLAVDASENGTARAGVLLAPGRDIPTLVPGGAYDFASGSSLAAAEVSATAALLRSADAKLPAAEIQRVLDATSRPLSPDDSHRRSIDACRALARITAGKACEGTAERVAADAPRR